MRITAVIGSPSREGNTAVLALEALAGARECGAETEDIVLAEHHIEYCRGCMYCLRTGHCVIDDDADRLRDVLYASDGIILASPAYGIQPTARMKNFLTDRIGMYSVYTSSLGGKWFAGISTAGGIGARKVARKLGMEYVSGFFLRSSTSGSLGVLRGNERVETVEGALEKARLLGRKLAGDIRSRKRYPLQNLGERALTRFIVKPVIMRNIRNNRSGTLKGVYENLRERGLL